MVAVKLMKACYELYHQTPTGVAWDSVYLQPHNDPPPPPPASSPPPRDEQQRSEQQQAGSGSGSAGDGASGASSRHLLGEEGKQKYIFRPRSVENFLRPEVAESLFYLWRATGEHLVPAISTEQRSLFRWWLYRAGAPAGVCHQCCACIVLVPVHVCVPPALCLCRHRPTPCLPVSLQQVTPSTASGAGTCSVRTSGGAASSRAGTRCSTMWSRCVWRGDPCNYAGFTCTTSAG